MRTRNFLFTFLLSFFILPISYFGQALLAEQGTYWVSFKDKGNFLPAPEDIFDSLALARRLSGNILIDQSDYPISSVYLEMVEQNSSEMIGYSKWFNACAIVGTKEQISRIASFIFVDRINEVIIPNSLQGKSGICSREIDSTMSSGNFSAGEMKIIRAQQESMGLSAWQKEGIAGKGIRVAVFDAGFPNVDVHTCFDHLRKNNQIIATKNFLKKKSSDVYDRNFHGQAVLSCIAGIKEGTFFGVAPDAQFLLAITEYGTREPFREELFWLMAAEWADEKGAHIISSSLGYGYHRYFFRDMDGNTSLVAKAAGKAASKGILVVNSAGNEGTDDWKMIITPADQDSVLAVGGVDPKTGFHINFSSYGPNYQGHVKPNVCAPGDVMAARGKKMVNIQGTSFSCPLMAGFAACLLQFKPDLIGKPIQTMRFLEEHSSLHPYFDYAHGYGIPDASYILSGVKNSGKAAFALKDESAKKSININLNETSNDPYFIEAWKHSLYVKFLDEAGKIISYQLFSVQPFTKEISAPYDKIENVNAVEVHYAGITKKIILNHYAH